MNKIVTRCISILLILTFITGQAYAGEVTLSSPVHKLAASAVSDPDINPGTRSRDVKNDIAGTANPGAIGNGKPLIALLRGDLPEKLELSEERYNTIALRIHRAIDLALRLYAINKRKIPGKFNKMAGEPQKLAEQGWQNLSQLDHSTLRRTFYPFNAGKTITSKEDYLIGFNPDELKALNREEIAALGVDFIDYLYSTHPPKIADMRLTQILHHECFPEKTIIELGVLNRSEHRAIYEEIQSAIYGADEVAALKQDIRNFINEKAGGKATPVKEAKISEAKAGSPVQIRTELKVPEGQPQGFFTNDYHSYRIAELFAKPVKQIPDAVVNAVKRKLDKDIAEGKLLSAVVKDFGGTDIDIHVTHRYGELNAAVQRLILEAMREGCLKAQELGLLKTDISQWDLAKLAEAANVKHREHSITERGSEPVVVAKLIGAGIGAANLILYHEFFIPGATPLVKLGFLPVKGKGDKAIARGFRAIVRRTDDIFKGKTDGDVWEFEFSSAANVNGVEYNSVNQSQELLALASQPNDFVITEIYAVEGSAIPTTEPLVSVVYQPVYGEKGNLRTLNPSFIFRSQSGADAVGGGASMIYGANFVPGGPNGECFVAIKPVTLEEARRAPEEGIANAVVYGWMSEGNGVVSRIVDHVGINPPALSYIRRLAKWLAGIMRTHEYDQPYLAPFAAEARVEEIRKEHAALFKHAPKEAEVDPVMDEVEAQVASGKLLSVTNDKADMGGDFGHNYVPDYMSAVYRATLIQAVRRGEFIDGNIIGYADKGRLEIGKTPQIGDDGHQLMIGDKTRNSAQGHQLSFLAFTRAYLIAVVSGKKPYGLAQDYQGKEAKAAKKYPYFYSCLDEEFFNILREVMPKEYLYMVDNLYAGWKKGGATKETVTLPEPFSGNVSQQGIGSARFLMDFANGERTFGILAGDKMGPAGINRPIREGVYAALKAGEFKNGLVFEIWDAKAFDEHGNIPLDKVPAHYIDVEDAVAQLKEKSDQKFVKSCYNEENGNPKDLKVNLTKEQKEKLADLLKKAGFVPTERIFLDAEKDKGAIYLYLADSDRFNIKQVWIKKNAGWDINNFQDYLLRPILGSSVTKLGILAGGEYVGKDDPVMVGNLKLMEHIWKYLENNPILLQGDMNGSHWLGAVPTEFKYAVANVDSHPILVGLRYTVNDEGKIVNVEDVFSDRRFDQIRNKMFKFNFEFKWIATLGGQFAPYGTDVRTVEASYPLAKFLRQLQNPASPFLVRNKPPETRKARPIGIFDQRRQLFEAAATLASTDATRDAAGEGAGEADHLLGGIIPAGLFHLEEQAGFPVVIIGDSRYPVTDKKSFVTAVRGVAKHAGADLGKIELGRYPVGMMDHAYVVDYATPTRGDKTILVNLKAEGSVRNAIEAMLTDAIPSHATRGADRGYITDTEHEEMRKFLQETKARSEENRMRDLERLFEREGFVDKEDRIEIYVVPNMYAMTGFRGHYAIKDGVIYVDRLVLLERGGIDYLRHEVYELIEIRKFATKKGWTLERLVNWLDETGDLQEVEAVLLRIHAMAPRLPDEAQELVLDKARYARDTRVAEELGVRNRPVRGAAGEGTRATKFESGITSWLREGRYREVAEELLKLERAYKEAVSDMANPYQSRDYREMMLRGRRLTELKEELAALCAVIKNDKDYDAILQSYPFRSIPQVIREYLAINFGFAAHQAAYTDEIERAVNYLQRLLPTDSKSERWQILENLVSSNVDDPRRLNYTRDGRAHLLPPTFIFKGSVFPGYKGKDKPRFIILTSFEDGVAINTIFSATQNEKLILAKGGWRWYQVGQEVGKKGEVIESLEEKFRGNPKKNLDPLLEEGVRLAETMSYKSPFWEVYFDYAKMISLAPKEVDKETFIRDVTASSILAGGLMKLCLFGPDTYTGYPEMGWIEDEKMKVARQFPGSIPSEKVLSTTSRDPKKFGTFPHEEWMATSIGVVETLVTALGNKELMEAYNIDMSDLSTAIVGFGDVGGGVIKYLHDFHPDIFNLIKIVLVADSKGAIYNPKGLDKEQLLSLIGVRAKIGSEFALKDYYKGEFEFIPDTRDAYFKGATILIPAARGTFIHTEEDIVKMAKAGTQIISEGSNNFAAIGTEDRFEPNGIIYFYGPVANGGGIYASKEEVFHALIEGTESMKAHMEERRLHIQGDIADIALGNARWLSDQLAKNPRSSIYEIHQKVVRDIIAERSRLLDNPTKEESAIIQARVENDLARGVEGNDEHIRILTIVNATELARERVMGKYIDRESVLKDLDSPNLATRRAGAYWAGKLRIQEAVGKLLDILKNPSANTALRRLAAISLAYINSPDVIEGLKAVERSGQVAGDVKVGVEWALHYMNASNAAPGEGAGESATRGAHRGYITAKEHKFMRKFLRDTKARSKENRRKELEGFFEICQEEKIRIYAVPNMQKRTGVPDHYAVREGVVYVDRELLLERHAMRYLGHVLYELVAIRRIAAQRGWSLHQLVNWLDNGPRDEVEALLLRIHVNAPQLPLEKRELEYHDVRDAIHYVGWDEEERSKPYNRPVRGAAGEGAGEARPLKPVSEEELTQFTESLRSKLAGVEKAVTDGKVWVIMREGFRLDYKNDAEAAQLYQTVMIQALRRLADRKEFNISLVKDKEGLLAEMAWKIHEGYRVVVIDDASDQSIATIDLSGLAELKDKYAVVQAQVERELELGSFQYFNLKAMVGLGIAMLDKDEGRISDLYNMLTGEAIAKDILQNIIDGTLKIVRLLPRIIRLSPGLDTYRLKQALIDIAA